MTVYILKRRVKYRGETTSTMAIFTGDNAAYRAMDWAEKNHTCDRFCSYCSGKKRREDGPPKGKTLRNGWVDNEDDSWTFFYDNDGAGVWLTVSPIRTDPDMSESRTDLNKCPGCGGPADNGHSREDPPAVYYCSKCEPQNPAETHKQTDKTVKT